MPGPTSRFWLTCRSASFALVTAYVSGLGHLLGGGSLPPIGTLLFAAAVVGGMVSGLARTRRGPMQMLAMVVGAQLAFHLLFSLDAHDMAPLDLPRMLAFHVVAAVLCALILAHGDRALFRLFAALHRVVDRALATPAALPSWPRPPAAAADPFARPAARHHCTTAPRRGPPQLAAS